MAGLDPTFPAFGRFLRDRTPRLVVTPLLVSLNVAIYVGMLVSKGRSFDVNTMLRWGALYGPLVGTGEWWRLLSSAFVHGGFWHLTLNMLALVYAGPLVERLVGPSLFVVCYLMTAIIASAASLVMHPTQLSVGASGAIFGIVGMLLSITIRGRRLSAREVVTETVAAFDASIAPVSTSITSLDLSSGRGQPHQIALAPTGASSSSPEHLPARFADDVLRNVYVGVFPFIVYNLMVSGVDPGIDGAAHVGGLVGGVVAGWFVAYDILIAKPSIVRAAVPIAIAALISGAAVIHLNALVDVRFEIVRFGTVDTRSVTTFKAAFSEMQSGVRSPDEVVTLVEARILPELLQARLRCDELNSKFQERLAEVEWKDQHGRMPRWRELEPSRNRLAQAVAWREYLAEREADWRLRVEAFRERTFEKLAEANHRDAVAAARFTAKLGRE